MESITKPFEITKKRVFDDKKRVGVYTDSTGIETNMEYDEDGNILHMKSNDGEEVWFTYANGVQTSYKDNKGGESYFYYDEKNRLIRSVDVQQGREERQVWDDEERPISYFIKTPQFENSWEKVFDDKGRVIKYIENGVIKDSEYCEFGLTKETSTDGSSYEAEYNSAGIMLHEKSINKEGKRHEWTRVVDDKNREIEYTEYNDQNC